MSSVARPLDDRDESASRRPLPAPIDERRGTAAMTLFIATEAALFLMLFFTYFYLAPGDWRWLTEEPPKLPLASTMLAVLVTSSVVLHWAEKKERAGEPRRARAGIGATVVLGLVFVAIQIFEYRDHLKTLKPWTDAYGSIFYTLTGIHGLHVVTGLAMLVYVLCLPVLRPADRAPFSPLHNAGLYWHFVDAVWVLIVALVYVLPNLR